MLKQRMEDAKQDRVNKYKQVKQELREVNQKSYRAHLEHMRQVSAEKIKRKQKEEREAKASFDRCHRDMAVVSQRKEDLRQQLDQEAAEARIHLSSIEKDIKEKTLMHDQSINQLKQKLLDKFDRDSEIFEQHCEIDASNLHHFSKKVLDKDSSITRKVKKTNQSLEKMKQQLKEHNHERFDVRDKNYANEEDDKKGK